MHLYAYPLFLILFIILLTRRYKVMSVLQWTGRWLLAIGLAYGATGCLIAASILIFGPIPDPGFRLPDYAYWQAFGREASGLAFIVTILGTIFLIMSRVRSVGEGTTAENAHSISLKKAAWHFTILLTINLALSIFLIIEPYVDSELNAQAVYRATRNFGLDPRNWFPFSVEGIGNVFYQMAFWVWAFAAFFLMPIAILQWLIIKRAWSTFYKMERIAHVASIAGSMLLAAFILTIGTRTLYWLLD